MKALGLLSGGLDSSLAVKMVMDQGIEVVAVKFTSAFCQCDTGGCNHAAELAGKLGIEFVTVAKGQEYLDIVREPKYGRGSGMNPCLDCRIFMLRKAKEIAEDIGASFIFTGEVLGQRPMSQRRVAMDLVEKEAGLEGKLVRPLSAQLLPPTEAEREGWLDREQLLAISGRGRKPQIKLAEEKGIVDYPCPAGGCLLTTKEFSAKLADHLAHSDRLDAADVAVLKVGRHFRIDGLKVVIGRDERENARLRDLAKERFIVIEPTSVPGPTCLCDAAAGEDVIVKAASIVARYSDGGGGAVALKIVSSSGQRAVEAEPMANGEIDSLRIAADKAPLTIEME